MNKLTTFTYALSLVLAACSTKENDQVESTTVAEGDTVTLSKEQFNTAGIELALIADRPLSGTIPVSGVLDVPPQNMQNITAPLGGFLRSTMLLQGMRVTKGQLIAVVENPEYVDIQQDYLDTKSQVEFLSAEYERQKHLAQENVNAQKTLQKSLADLTSMKARNSGLAAKLGMLNIDVNKLQPESIRATIDMRAPMSGYVTEVFSSVGAFVSPTEVMFKIVDTEHLHAELICFERDIPRIKVGQKIRFTLAHETEERTARVYLIGREINADRTVRIHGHLDKEDRELIPGMYLRALIETGTTLLPSLPEEAVISFEGKEIIVLQVSDGTYALMEITTGIRENGYVEVKTPEGFNAKDTPVVIRNAYKVLARMKNKEEEE